MWHEIKNVEKKTRKNVGNVEKNVGSATGRRMRRFIYSLLDLFIS